MKYKLLRITGAVLAGAPVVLFLMSIVAFTPDHLLLGLVSVLSVPLVVTFGVYLISEGMEDPELYEEDNSPYRSLPPDPNLPFVG